MVSHPSQGDEQGLSPAYYAVKAHMDEWKRWDALTPRQKFDEIVEKYPPEEWVTEENLNILAVFRDAPALWLRVVMVGRSIGVNIFNLEKTITAIRDRHARWKLSEMRRAIHMP